MVAVLIFHARDQVFFVGHSRLLNSLESGQAGVDVFFVLSGFIMTLISETRYRSPAAFLTERVVRIAPLYWLITAFVYFISIVEPGLLRATHQDLGQLLKSLLFIAFEKEPGLVRPVVFVGWTLNYEMLFYSFFAVAMLFGHQRYNVLFASLIALTALGVVIHTHNAIVQFYTDPVMCEFLFGVFVGRIRPRMTTCRGPSWSIACLASACGMVVVMVVMFDQVTHARLLAFGIPAAIILWLVIQAEANGARLKRGLITLIGDASYSIYLTHFFITQAAAKAWGRVSIPMPWTVSLIAVGCVVVLAILAGVVVYRLVEVPLSRTVRLALERASHGGLRLAWPAPKPMVMPPEAASHDGLTHPPPLPPGSGG